MFRSFEDVTPIFGRHLVIMLLIVHLLPGFQRHSEIDYYLDEPLILRLLGLASFPIFPPSLELCLRWK